MKHFRPAPINDCRDHWLMFGDGLAEVKDSEDAVWEEVSNCSEDYPKWWTQIIRFNSDEGICRVVTDDFEVEPDDTAGIPRDAELLREHLARVR